MINNKLHKHQNLHAKKIIKALNKHNAAIDGSDTGTGKTYVALAIAKQLNLIPVVLTQFSAISAWGKVANYLNVVNYYITNYEQYQRGNPRHITKDYEWKTTKKHLLIFDEAHKCSNYRTINSRLMRAAKSSKSKILCLSATIAEDPTQMYSVGIILGLFSTWPQFLKWGNNYGMGKSWPSGLRFRKKNRIENLNKLNKILYTEYGSRMRVKDIKDFPKNLVITSTYNMEQAKKIQKLWDELKNIKTITKRLRIRQAIELLKIDTFYELTQNYLEKKKSVIIFVNFKETIKQLTKKLNVDCIIDGSVVGDERKKNIERFQKNEAKVIICNNRAGGISINLHDLSGIHQRICLISLPEGARDLKQILGRAARSGAKSNVIQRIILCSNTVEDDIAKNLEQKIKNIDTINDGDLFNTIKKIKRNTKGQQK